MTMGQINTTIGQVNGHPVYMLIGKRDSSTPFMQAYDTWEEGTKKSQLSDKELNYLKQKYNSNKLSDKETIELLGDLVKLGVLSKNDAHLIYLGAIPLDVSNYDGTTQGSLTKCNANDPVRGRSFGSFLRDRGYWEFKSTFEEIKASANSKSDSSYVKSYDSFLQITEQLRRNTIKYIDKR